jgi:hypothetical protein
MRNIERRSCERHPITIPVRFCQGGAAFGTEVKTRSVNISQSGLLITSPVPLAIGSTVLMSIKVPTEISGSAFNELQCLGRVVHRSQIGDAAAYGIKIDRISRDSGARIGAIPHSLDALCSRPETTP